MLLNENEFVSTRTHESTKDIESLLKEKCVSSGGLDGIESVYYEAYIPNRSSVSLINEQVYVYSNVPIVYQIRRGVHKSYLWVQPSMSENAPSRLAKELTTGEALVSEKMMLSHWSISDMLVSHIVRDYGSKALKLFHEGNLDWLSTAFKDAALYHHRLMEEFQDYLSKGVKRTPATTRPSSLNELKLVSSPKKKSNTRQIPMPCKVEGVKSLLSSRFR